MLNRLIIKNINSIDICDIDFKKDKYKYLDNNVNGDIVNPVAIYGHNGSGKTAIINAIQQLVLLMNEPATNLRPFIVNNFLFDEYGKSTSKKIELVTGSIELFFDVNGVNYDYFIATSSFYGIENEYLKCDNNVVFERNKKTYTYHDSKKNTVDVSSLISTLRSLASKDINDENIQKAYTYLSSFTVVIPSKISSGLPFVSSKIFNNVNFMDLLVSKSKEVKEILKGYNEFPIYNIVKKETKNMGIMNTSKYYIQIEGKKFNG